MWLKLDLEGIDFHFRISEYKPSTNQNWDTNWCKVDLTIQAANWLNYQIEYDETLLAAEVENLRDAINKLFTNRTDEHKVIECMEPDLEFHMHSEKYANNNAYAYMEFIIAFWDKDHSLSANRMILNFGEDDLKILRCYLNLVTGLNSDNDDEVQRCINEGYLY